MEAFLVSCPSQGQALLPRPSKLHRKGKRSALCLSSLLGSILMGMLLAFHSGDLHLLHICDHGSTPHSTP